MKQLNKTRVSVYILIAIAFFVALIMLGVVGASVLGFIGALSGAFTGAEVAILALIAMGATVTLGSIVVLYLAAAIGLVQQKQWARRLARLLSAIQLFNMPLGTVAGLFVLYTLYRDAPPAIAAKEAQFNNG